MRLDRTRLVYLTSHLVELDCSCASAFAPRFSAGPRAWLAAKQGMNRSLGCAFCCEVRPIVTTPDFVPLCSVCVHRGERRPSERYLAVAGVPCSRCSENKAIPTSITSWCEECADRCRYCDLSYTNLRDMEDGVCLLCKANGKKPKRCPDCQKLHYNPNSKRCNKCQHNRKRSVLCDGCNRKTEVYHPLPYGRGLCWACYMK